ncbi:MAG: response regulator [Planctomycetes bacterium]|nr:response regulator [Planctomycetota bacterium]
MPDQPKTVLVVDDEEDVVRYLTSLLEDNGYDVLPAYDGKEGMDLAKKEKPDLISLDITMPEKTGVRMFRDLYEDPETRDIPVVIVTAIDPNFKKFIYQRQKLVPPPAAYFEKPIDKEEFLAEVNRILGTSKGQEG